MLLSSGFLFAGANGECGRRSDLNGEARTPADLKFKIEQILDTQVGVRIWVRAKLLVLFDEREVEVRVMNAVTSTNVGALADGVGTFSAAEERNDLPLSCHRWPFCLDRSQQPWANGLKSPPTEVVTTGDKMCGPLAPLVCGRRLKGGQELEWSSRRSLQIATR
jgi:hypothetical protein